jgi:hypothetical protein
VILHFATALSTLFVFRRISGVFSKNFSKVME